MPVVPDPRYRLEYSNHAVSHLRSLTARDRANIIDTIERKLLHQPTVPARNRKLLRANDIAPWELRVGPWRCYYDVQESPRRIVTVRAVGRKERNRVVIGGVEYEL